MRAAPASRAPSTALSPTPPAPKTATLLPGRTCAVFSTAPTPVVTAHPINAATASGTASGSGTQHSCGTTIQSLKQPSAL